MTLRMRSRAAAFAVTICLAVIGNSGRAQSMLSGHFVNHDNPVEVDMLRLVESPPGHLSGSLVVSSLNADGSRKKDASYDVTGTITRPNVSLQLEGGLVGLAEFFGASTNLVGSLKGGTLTLSAGNQTEVFHETSQEQYDAVLAGLDETGHHIAMVRQAVGAVQEVEANDQQLNADLTNYIAWGKERINHVSGVRNWYADRETRYTKCLQTIRPLAAQGIPSWRWQACALAVENDKYYRDQETQSIPDLQGKNRDTIAALDARIAAAQHQFPKALDELKSACPYATNIGACEKELQRLTSLPPDGLLDGHLIAGYRSIVPQVDAAISADLQTATTGQSNLANIADEVEKVYRSAR
ncbi:MAG: hypothetical protein ACLGPM_05780 [Acidobacteriota bacterium]